MLYSFVVGLFESKGIAEDACNRLKSEGVPAPHISLLVLHETAMLPVAMTPEIEAMAVDPLIVGNVRDTYAPYISNGETVVFVRTADAEEIDVAVGTLRQYTPLRVMLVDASDGAPLSRELP